MCETTKNRDDLMNERNYSKFSPNIVIITGDCGVGKTTLIPFLKKQFNPKEYLIHDMDEIRPSDLSLNWRISTTEYWIKYGKIYEML